VLKHCHLHAADVQSWLLLWKMLQQALQGLVCSGHLLDPMTGQLCLQQPGLSWQELHHWHAVACLLELLLTCLPINSHLLLQHKHLWL
jgi:hypothetical protein